MTRLFTSVKCSTAQKVCAKMHSAGIKPFVMSQQALITHQHLTQVRGNIPSP